MDGTSFYQSCFAGCRPFSRPKVSVNETKHVCQPRQASHEEKKKIVKKEKKKRPTDSGVSLHNHSRYTNIQEIPFILPYSVICCVPLSYSIPCYCNLFSSLLSLPLKSCCAESSYPKEISHFHHWQTAQLIMP